MQREFCCVIGCPGGVAFHQFVRKGGPAYGEKIDSIGSTVLFKYLLKRLIIMKNGLKWIENHKSVKKIFSVEILFQLKDNYLRN